MAKMNSCVGLAHSVNEVQDANLWYACRARLCNNAILDGLCLGLAVVLAPTFNLARLLDSLEIGLPGNCELL
jgi:hypothetical protein